MINYCNGRIYFYTLWVLPYEDAWDSTALQNLDKQTFETVMYM
jgi:hypothetical protein